MMDKKGGSQPLISVAIPVYNWDLRALLGTLEDEIVQNGLQSLVEIVVVDDGSSSSFQSLNRQSLAGCFGRYFQHATNQGRSASRNTLISKVKGEYVLFLDADMLPDSRTFLQQYILQAQKGNQLVCGGVSYSVRILNEKKYDFAVYKGRKTEALSAQERNRIPWRYFFTSNVLVQRELLSRVPFSEEFALYGYEDIDWGIRLSQHCPPLHIDNTASHLGLLVKKEVLERMRQSIDNFLLIKQKHPDHFRQTGVSSFVGCMDYLPLCCVTLLDRILVRCFLAVSSVKAAFVLFQVDKAVLLSIAGRRQG
jgi:glycosyltransferase involved in cell wall biosynthesis